MRWTPRGSGQQSSRAEHRSRIRDVARLNDTRFSAVPVDAQGLSEVARFVLNKSVCKGTRQIA